MIEFINLRAGSFDLDRVDLQWEMRDTTENHLLFTTYVQRSESVSGPWDTLTGGLKDVWFFSDTTVPNRKPLRTLFYRLRAVQDSNQEETFTNPVRIEAEQDLLGEEMSRRQSLVYREFSGRDVVVYPVRTFGTRCNFCWDDIQKKRVKSRCISCFSTGYAGGYMRPLLITMNVVRGAPDRKVATKYNVSEDKIATGNTWNFPTLKPDDLVIEKENKRWKIGHMEVGEKLRSVIWQRSVMYSIDHGHILFKLPVPVDPNDFQASPAREFSRPTDLESVGDRELDFDFILQAFSVGGPK